MPYTAKGKCVYRADTGKKVGCTTGSVKKYLGALHANVPDAKNEASCPHCDGQGWFPTGETDKPHQEQCPHCQGTGETQSETDPKITKLKEMIREIVQEIINEQHQ